MTSQSYSRLLPSEPATREAIGVPSVEMVDAHTEVKTEFDARTLAYYEKCAGLYDFLYPDHLSYSKALFESLLPVFRENKVRRVLDASCGVGHDMSCLLGHGFQVDGLDASKAMLAEAGRRLSRAGWRGFSLRSGDVRTRDCVAEAGTYDLVIFRGNTFSNVRPNEIPSVIRNLAHATRPGGLLCLDYRNGHILIQERKPFELRGVGFDRRERLLYLSFYTLVHTKSIEQAYRVQATVVRFDLKHGVHIDRFKIRSHYVAPELVFSGIQSSGCKLLLRPESTHIGLPCLENVIALNEA